MLFFPDIRCIVTIKLMGDEVLGGTKNKFIRVFDPGLLMGSCRRAKLNTPFFPLNFIVLQHVS
jgi:hypothetical protein